MNIHNLIRAEAQIEMIEILDKFIRLNESFFSQKTIEHLKEMLRLIKEDELNKKFN